jgi:intraflagellar transport protein 20
LRMAVQNETEGRNRQKRTIQTVINEKRAELDRINVQLQSLERIESEQRSMIERFTNSQS